ncbi:MAG: DUF4491 family protein [Prevotellaceae bacterium]|jgi:hypothetical protein|nr:DUF4491 family protein [Prevotellaceae bacterium]
MEFIQNWNLTGLLIGLSTFFIIGICHPIVIKCEYHFGVRCWWAFLLTGAGGIAGTLLVHDIFWSSLLSICAFSSFWSILELFQQRERVRKGWFPKKSIKQPAGGRK